jgi:two-component sensor histidine kinase
MCPWLICYSLALLTPALALGLTWLLPSLQQQTPSPLFYLSVMVSAWWGGLGPGLFAVAASVAALHYFLLPPLYTLAFRWGDVVRLPTFLGVALAIAFLQGRRWRAEAALRGLLVEKDRLLATLAAAVEHQNVLLHEVHHRVKNNLQVVSSMLRLQARAVPDPRLRRILEESSQRLRAIAFLHETIHQAADLGHVDAQAYLRPLVQQLVRAYRRPGQAVRLSLDLAALTWDIDRAMSCGLIVHELMSNSLTHAFPHGRAGDIVVTLQEAPPGRCTLMVCDTGVGLPEGFAPQTAQTLGLRLVALLARQLEGTFTLTRDGGTRATVTFPG